MNLETLVILSHEVLANSEKILAEMRETMANAQPHAPLDTDAVEFGQRAESIKSELAALGASRHTDTDVLDQMESTLSDINTAIATLPARLALKFYQD